MLAQAHHHLCPANTIAIPTAGVDYNLLLTQGAWGSYVEGMILYCAIAISQVIAVVALDIKEWADK